MKSYLVKTAAALVAIICLHVVALLLIPAPVPAEYWTREAIIVKQSIAASLPSPRIIFLGGSTVLFGIDAKVIEASTGISTLNMGTHAGLRLDRALNIGEDASRPGDVLVLALERRFYGCNQQDWTPWQIRNVLAWDRDYFDAMPLRERIWATITAGDPSLMFETVANAIGTLLFPGLYAQRSDALAPRRIIVERFVSGRYRPKEFKYSAYNLDDRGDILQTEGDGAVEPSASDVTQASICPTTLETLAQFVARMHAKNVRVVFSHEPSLLEHAPGSVWKDSEAKFVRDIRSIGSGVLENGDTMFFPRQSFFRSAGHLNDAARRKRSLMAAADLKRLGIAKSDERR